MVREGKITAPALYVEGDTQVLFGDRRALDMPARSPAPARALPRRLAGTLTTPDQAVKWLALPHARGITAALREDFLHRPRVEPGHGPKPLVRLHREVQVVLHRINGTKRKESLDVGVNEGNGFDRTHVVIGWQDAQSCHVRAKEFGLALRQSDPVLPRGIGAL
jgi:hypothetical protein